MGLWDKRKGLNGTGRNIQFLGLASPTAQARLGGRLPLGDTRKGGVA